MKVAEKEIKITRELIEKRMVELEKIKAGAMAQYQAAHGGIQDCLYWLDIQKEKKE